MASKNGGGGSRSKPIKWLQYNEPGGSASTLYPIMTQPAQSNLEKGSAPVGSACWTTPPSPSPPRGLGILGGIQSTGRSGSIFSRAEHAALRLCTDPSDRRRRQPPPDERSRNVHVFHKRLLRRLRGRRRQALTQARRSHLLLSPIIAASLEQTDIF